MLSWSILVALALLTGGGVWKSRERRRQRLRSWAAAVERCALTDVEVPRPAGPLRMTAFSGRLKVRFSEYAAYVPSARATYERHTGTRVVIESPQQEFAVHLRLETLVGNGGGVEIELGDSTFDRAFHVGGGPARAFAALDRPVRGQLVALADGRTLEVSGRFFTVELAEDHAGGAAAVPHVVARQLDLAHRLVDHTDVAERLAQNALDDACVEVRLNNLLTLAREFPDSAVTASALRTACSDPVPEIRRRAALALGDEGRPVLRALLDSEADDLCMARTVATLALELPAERTLSILERALRGRCLETARACLDVLGRRGDPTTIPVLAKVLAVELRSEIGVAAASALGSMSHPQAEEPLAKALRYESAELRIAAAQALGRVGSVAAVVPLKDCAANDKRDRELERAVRQAISEIQSRATGASPGQVSLTGSETGQLSIPEGTSGRVSLDDSRDET